MQALRCMTALVAVGMFCSGEKNLHALGYPNSHNSQSWANVRNKVWRTTPTGPKHEESTTNPANSSSVRYCGTSVSDPFQNRIVGGVETTPHEFPWIAKLFHKKSFHCGAVLIADKYLLTAGHCVTSHVEGTSTEPRRIRGNILNYQTKDPKEFIAELGAHRLKEKSVNVVRRRVKRVIVNRGYDVFASTDIMLQTNDIAILQIAPVKFTAHVLPICLPVRNALYDQPFVHNDGSKVEPVNTIVNQTVEIQVNFYTNELFGTSYGFNDVEFFVLRYVSCYGNEARVRDGSQLVVAGWGSVLTETLSGQTTKLPNALQKALLTKINFNVCKNNPNVGMHLTQMNQLTSNEMFCMMGANQDSCRGDSGGPAALRTPQGYVVAGLVSWGLGCNQKNYPAAYTQVSSYMDFILANTKGARFLPHQP